jgi:arsenate reductase
LKEKLKVIFLCTYNSARSQMAEAFLRRIGGDRFIVFSAGINPLTINYCTRKVMDELGYDLQDHYSKDYKKCAGVKFDFVITLCDEAQKKCKTMPQFKDSLHWSFKDPGPCRNRSVEEIEKYRTVRDQILEKIENWLKIEFV